MGPFKRLVTYTGTTNTEYYHEYHNVNAYVNVSDFLPITIGNYCCHKCFGYPSGLHNMTFIKI